MLQESSSKLAEIKFIQLDFWKKFQTQFFENQSSQQQNLIFDEQALTEHLIPNMKYIFCACLELSRMKQDFDNYIQPNNLYQP